MDWYYADGEDRIGPLSESRFDALVDGGTISDETLVWHDGMADWKPYAAASSQNVAPVSYTDEEPILDTATRTYAAPLDVSGAKYGGFWIRFVAKVVDNIITGIAGVVIQMPLMLVFGALGSSSDSLAIFGGMLSVLTSIAFPAAYSTWFIGRFGATPGKMALGLKVVRADGASVSYGRAFARHVAEFLSAIILAIGYIMAAFDAEKRTLHDHICDTRVIVSRR